jgi:hypothetical protein
VSRFPWKAVAVGSAIAGGLGAIVLASRKASAQSLPSSTTQRVALIGDSYAVGLGPELQKLLPNFKSSGVVSTNTAQWAAHSAPCGSCGDWLTAFKPDVVLVSLGVNDGAAPNRANYQTLVSGLHGLGARVIWIEPPADVQHADAARQIIASLGVQTVPATTTPLAGDGLHPTSYAPWARDVATAVTRA